MIQALRTVGIEAFGVAMPLLSPSWTDGTMPTVNDKAMSLNISGGSWLAPLAGIITRCDSIVPNVTLIQADGSVQAGPGLLISLFPQEYLRLKRLYASILESGTINGSTTDQPIRPVPRYFFFSGTPESSNGSGVIAVQTSIGLSGNLTIYDADGMPIDPLFVAAAFTLFMDQHNLLQHRDPISSSFSDNSQVKQIAGLAGETKVTRLRFSDFAGQPYDGSHLSGITSVDPDSGQFSLDEPTKGTASVTKEAGTGISGSFPDEDRRLLVIGMATTGRLGDNISPPSLPTGITLKRDFFSMRAVKLKSQLLGTPPSSFTPIPYERQARVRINEPLDLLTDGNDILASAAAALNGSPTESLCVAQSIDESFNVPTNRGKDSHWPAFPALGGVTAAVAGTLPLSLRDNLNPSAHFFDDSNPATPNVDVILTLNGLPAGAAVRIYPRKFIEDAREARGDGVGGVVSNSGILTLHLVNPFGFSSVVTTPPSLPTLRFDLMVVKRTGESRLYGNIEVQVGIASTSELTISGSNPFGTASRRGISNAGVLGLGTQKLPSLAGFSTLEATQRTLQALTGETNPRDASRLPTMARRDLLVAGRSSTNWKAVLASGRLAGESLSADQRLGCPGSPGGRETQVVGVSTQNARLSYDIARMAFRRTTNLVSRMIALADSSWDEPAQPAALAVGSAPTESQGTIAGAVLQTIAPFCETPELSLLKTSIEANLGNIPADFNSLVDLLDGQIKNLASSLEISGNSFLNGIVTQMQSQLVTALNNLKSNTTLNENQRDRLYNELHRELLASCYGRRDSLWALHEAIGRACKFIYIESPGFASIIKDYQNEGIPAYAVDLIDSIRSRLLAAPALRVIICTPKFPDYPAVYEVFAAQEAFDRRAKILSLPSEKVVSFHPIGFPGRPSRLESTVVIVDDLWCLVGSSTFRRRGLTFDGSSDLVFTDTNLVEGRSPAIASFRRKLLATRLSIKSSTTNSFGFMPEATYVRLNDCVEAFYVIREMLVAGGLGKIERLWKGITPYTTPVTPASFDIADPEGQEFDLLGTLALEILNGLNTA